MVLQIYSQTMRQLQNIAISGAIMTISTIRGTVSLQLWTGMQIIKIY